MDPVPCSLALYGSIFLARATITARVLRRMTITSNTYTSLIVATGQPNVIKKPISKILTW
jgi:hypothetical protein